MLNKDIRIFIFSQKFSIMKILKLDPDRKTRFYRMKKNFGTSSEQ